MLQTKFKKDNNNGTVAKLYLALNNCFFIIIIDTYFFYLVIKLIWRQVTCDIALL